MTIESFLTIIKYKEQYKSIPCLVISKIKDNIDRDINYIFKPLCFSKLSNKLNDMLLKPNPIKSSSSPGVELDHPQFNLKILVAEDNSINQKVITSMLRKLGCKVELANDGKEAVQLYENNRYDLIFMDCQMPNLDGYGATREIRKLNDDGQIPIIALTANAMLEDRENCLKAGMNEHISKPVRIVNIIEILNNYVD